MERKVTVKDFGGKYVDVPISDLSNFRAYEYESDYGQPIYAVAVDVANNRKHRTPRTTDVLGSVTGDKATAERRAVSYAGDR